MRRGGGQEDVVEQLEEDPARYLPEVTDDDLADDVVRINLNRPMDEIRAELRGTQ